MKDVAGCVAGAGALSPQGCHCLRISSKGHKRWLEWGQDLAFSGPIPLGLNLPAGQCDGMDWLELLPMCPCAEGKLLFELKCELMPLSII